MTNEKKTFRVVYTLIQQNKLTEKEAFTLVESIFNPKIEYVPVSLPEPEPTENPVEVQGFLKS